MRSLRRCPHRPIGLTLQPYTQAKQPNQENHMLRSFPITWTSLQIALAGASTYVLCSTDLLRGAAIFLH
jgi:hypothetical protein